MQLLAYIVVHGNGLSNIFEHFQPFSAEFWSAAWQTEHRRIAEQGTKRLTRKVQWRRHEGTNCGRPQNPKECQETDQGRMWKAIKGSGRKEKDRTGRERP